MSLQELKNHRQSILHIAEKYGASNVRIFGSTVKGTNTPHSDIDFLVNLAPDRSLLDLGGLLMELKDLLNCEVDVVTENGLRDRIRNKVIREAIPI